MVFEMIWNRLNIGESVKSTKWAISVMPFFAAFCPLTPIFYFIFRWLITIYYNFGDAYYARTSLRPYVFFSECVH